MNKTLKFINALIEDANPDKYGAISYNKYFRDLTNISNNIIDEAEDFKEEINNKLKALKTIVLELPESNEKKSMLELL